MKKIANFLIIEKHDNIFTISMSAELQDDVGTVGFVHFTNKSNVIKNDEILKIEASKTVLSIKTPLAGQVVEINRDAISNPKLLNSPDSGKNWIIKLTSVDENEFNSLPNF